MSDYRYLLDIALILLGTKAFGLFTRKLRMPAVVGALLAGIILGPAVLNWVQPSNLISSLSEIGVIVLMFGAGLETSITDLKKAGLKALVIAVLGVLVPLGLGYWIATFYNVGPEAWIGNLFLGVILTATSVGITVETLKEMGAMKTTSGNAILAAAVIDDVLGIIALTIVSGLADSSVNVGIVLLKIVLFFIFAVIVGVLLHKVFAWWFDHDSRGGLQRYSIISFAFALIMAFVSEEFFGVADITGAYFAGLIISMTQREPYIASRFDVLSYTYLSPIFFASIGLKVSLPEMNGTIVAFAVVLTIVAILTKVVGCGLGAKLCHYKNYQAIRIGVGMISRGEVALIVASKGESLGMMSTAVMGPVVIVVILTTIIAPILLKPVFKRGPETTPDPNVDMSKNYEAINKFREGK